jgi:DNA-binding transcriptional ArsR family regulator
MTMLDALASPARQELISQLGEGPATVRDLARALGRTRQSLHYHVAVLERAGLVRGAGWRGAGAARERIYAVAKSRMVVATAPAGPDRAMVLKAVGASLRLTTRELARALSSPGLRRQGAASEIAVLRGKARLTRKNLRELHGLFGRIEDLLRRAKQGRGKRYYAVTFILVPSGPLHGSPSS